MRKGRGNSLTPTIRTHSRADATPLFVFTFLKNIVGRHFATIPQIATWGEFVTEAMRKVVSQNPRLSGVLDVQDFNEQQSGQRTLDDDRLVSLIEVISQHRLGLQDTEPDILGRAYEYLLRKFAEGQGQSAGEFYTPKEVGWLMARLIDPEPYTTIYDPACGSGGLLIKPRLLFEMNASRRKGRDSKALWTGTDRILPSPWQR